MPIDCCPLDENGHFPGCRLLARVAELEAALERIHKGEQPAHKIASDALWKSRGEKP